MGKKSTKIVPDQLHTMETRLLRIEEMLDGIMSALPREFWLCRSLTACRQSPTIKEERRLEREAAVEPWQYLVRRSHAWRKQLYIKGRNLTARQLVGAIAANQFDETSAADNYHLPVEAIREAIAYVEKNTPLLELEAEIERMMLKRGGTARG